MNRLSRRLKNNRLIQRVRRHAGFSTLFHESARGVEDAPRGTEPRLARAVMRVPAEDMLPAEQSAAGWLPEEADVSLPPAAITVSAPAPAAATSKPARVGTPIRVRPAAPVHPAAVHTPTGVIQPPAGLPVELKPEAPAPQPEETGPRKFNTDDWARLHAIMERHEAQQAAQPEPEKAADVSDTIVEPTGKEPAGNHPVIQRAAVPPLVERASETLAAVQKTSAVPVPPGVPQINSPERQETPSRETATGLEQNPSISEGVRPQEIASPQERVIRAVETGVTPPLPVKPSPKFIDDLPVPDLPVPPLEPGDVEYYPADREPPLDAETRGLPPLEMAWPVERTPGLEQQIQSSLQGLPRKPVTTSAVELITPRTPRPVVEKAAAASQAPRVPEDIPAPEPLSEVEEATLPEPVTREAKRSSLPPPAAQTPRTPPVVQRAAGPGMVPTEIGPLPEDLWGLIGEPAPAVNPPAQTDTEPVSSHHGAEAPVVQRLTVDQPVSQVPAATAQAAAPLEHGAPVASAARAETGTAAQTPAANINVDELARQVYQEIRTRLQVEWERLHRRM